MIERLQVWIEDMQRRRRMALFRENMAWFGCPLDHLTDSEIDAMMTDVCAALAATGMSAQEATDAFQSALQGRK